MRLTVSKKCAILVNDEAQSRIVTVNTAGFLFPVKNHSFGVYAPILFGNGRSALCLVSQDTARLNGIGALSFKTIRTGKHANAHRPLTHTVGDSTMHALKHFTAATPGTQIPMLKLHRVML